VRSPADDDAAGPGGDVQLIRAALAAARQTGPDDVPIGAVIIGSDGVELARAANARELLGDPTAHAEILALRAAARVHGDGWRLEGATLAVTVEPCTMCAGALVMARVSNLVFGAWEPKTGAVGSLWDVVRDRRLTHRPRVRGGVLAEDCAGLLEDFFRRQRDRGASHKSEREAWAVPHVL
jgi:tRNA(adenine34) deaminase